MLDLTTRKVEVYLLLNMHGNLTYFSHSFFFLFFFFAAKYILYEKKGIVSIVMHKESTAADVLQAFMHALVMANLVEKYKSAHSESQSWMDKHYEDLVLKVNII